MKLNASAKTRSKVRNASERPQLAINKMDIWHFEHHVSLLGDAGCPRVEIYVIFVHTELSKKPAHNTFCTFFYSTCTVPYKFHQLHIAYSLQPCAIPSVSIATAFFVLNY
jgi:hypothetical protein